MSHLTNAVFLSVKGAGSVSGFVFICGMQTAVCEGCASILRRKYQMVTSPIRTKEEIESMKEYYLKRKSYRD